MPDAVPTRGEEIQAFILANLDLHPTDIAALTAGQFGISRQAVNLHLQTLEREGKVTSEGKTKGKVYRRPVRIVELPIAGLAEHDVYREHVQPLLIGLPENVQAICEYGVTEIVNNAIDHSESDSVRVEVTRTADSIQIVISDHGVGIFRKIHAACSLEDIRHAVFELTKGKLTTDPKHHTGEGIFFTSRLCDQFSILSYGLFLGHRRDGNDWLLQDPEAHAQTASHLGTMVVLRLDPKSTHTKEEVFSKYASEQDDFAFNKTHVLVELARTGEESFISRSQAKRILTRLEKFKEVVLDFQDVDEIGPAFSDQIFRVFTSDHPHTHLIPINMNERVTRMVRRAAVHEAGSNGTSGSTPQAG